MEAGAQKPAIELLPLARQKVQHEQLCDTVTASDSLFAQAVNTAGNSDCLPNDSEKEAWIEKAGELREAGETSEAEEAEPAAEKRNSVAELHVLRIFFYIRPIFLFKRSPH